MTDVIVGFDVRACVHVDVEHGHITRVAIDPLPNDHPRHLGGPAERLEAAIVLCEDPATAWPQCQRAAGFAQPAITRFADQHAYLSNFHPSPVVLDGAPYPTLEHVFQAAKATQEHERQEIRDAPTPAKAKRRGRRLSLADDWEARRVDVMRALLADKFTRHPDLGARLVATGTRRLVEANTRGDRFWDVCDGRGHNRLGRLLMDLRAQLAHRTASTR